ncbi:cytochrome b-c1 complex subunit 6-like [Durio zibethinus]|uniref:Complex III subunit VI n=1 Tax=Durio zibethinus TaxID=66656 RepID=A0A6P6AB19_DURZI|nr:cytochrome b-c1 complex subunit 6-like [Durio zibethinus]
MVSFCENSVSRPKYLVTAYLQACVKRIQGDESGHKHCTGQYFDYWSCIDKCVAPSLFSKLK